MRTLGHQQHSASAPDPGLSSPAPLAVTAFTHFCLSVCTMCFGLSPLSHPLWPPRWHSSKASASRAEGPGFKSRLQLDFFGVKSYQWLQNWHSSGYPARRLALLGQHWDWSAWCQYTVTGWGRTLDLQLLSQVWQHVKLSEQIRPWDTLACCWDVKQPTNKQSPPVDSRSEPAWWCCWLTSSLAWPIRPYFLQWIFEFTGSWSAVLHRSSLVVFSGLRIHMILCRQLLIDFWSSWSVSGVILLVSDP